MRHPVRRIVTSVFVLLLASALAASAATTTTTTSRLGSSVRGRPIGVVRTGERGASARATVLVVGCTHGNECAGRAVVARLEHAAVPAHVQLLLVRDLDPDGFAARTRANAHGVDLNRNSTRNWRATATAGGPRPFSEPESRLIRRLILRERPDLIVWYHQALAIVDVPYGRSAAVSRRYAGRVGLPVRNLGGRPGSLSDWANGVRGVGPSFVVELPGGALRPASAARHASAVLAEARRIAAVSSRR